MKVTLSLLALSVAVATSAQPTLIFEERFDSELDSSWSWVRPVPDDWKLESGGLWLRLRPGGLFEDHDGGGNLLLRDLALDAAGVVVSVRLTHRPEGLYENGGIILYRDDDNYVVDASQQP